MSVTLHTAYSSKGRSQSFAKTRHDLDTTNIGRNEARSVTLTDGSRVVLYTKTDCTGSAVWLNKSVANLKDTGDGGKDRNFHRKVASILVNPVEIPISVKVITSRGLPQPFVNLDHLKAGLNKVIGIQNRTTWEDTLIQFKPVAEVFKVSGHADLFDLDYNSNRDTNKIRKLQRDPHRLDLYIVNSIDGAGGFCSDSGSTAKDLGCVITGENILKWAGRKLSHEFGHHLGLGHQNDRKNNLMKQGEEEAINLLQWQISDMHETIAKKLSNYRLNYT